MKARLLLTSLTLLAILAGFAPLQAHPQVSAQQLRRLVVENPDSVLRTLDAMEADVEAPMPEYQRDLLRGLAYNEKRMYSLVERYALRVLRHDSISHHPKVELSALTMLAQAKAFFGNYTGSIESALKGMEIARRIGNVPGEYNILNSLASTSFEIGDRKKGYEYLETIISGGEKSTDIRVLASVTAALGDKVIQLYADDRFAEGLAEGKRRLDVINTIDRLGGAPEGFTDQQRAYAYARIASCAERLGRKDEAAEAYDAFSATDYARHPMGRAFIMDYLLDAHRWDKALEITGQLEPLFTGTDTINPDYQSMLTAESRALAGTGDYRAAYGLSLRAAAIRDSLNARQRTLEAQELATVFALNEKDIALAHSKAALHRRQMLLIVACGVGLLVLVILLLVARAYAISLKQQRLAAKRIDELTASTAALSSAAADGAGDADKQRFIELQTKLLEQKPFTDPAFSRTELLELSGLPRNKTVQLIQEYAGLTPNDYINRLRVDYSVNLIRTHPEWTIDAIAESSGYLRRATYYSNFNKFFGITPAQYRKERIKS